MTRFANRLPVGPGSRGGQWHDPAYRRAYWRAWRAAHPEYRERECRRKAESRRRLALERDRREVEALLALVRPAGGPGTRPPPPCRPDQPNRPEV